MPASTWCQLLFFAAWATARTASTCARCVRYSLDACTSEGGSRLADATAATHGCLVVRRGLEHDRHGVDAAERDLQAAVDRRCGADDARALDAERDGGEAVGAAGGDPDLRQQLAGADRGHVDAEEEVLRRDRALAVRAVDRHLGAERGQQRRQVVRRVVRADVPADRAAVSHLHVGDLRADLAEDRAGARLARLRRSRCRSSSRRSRACRRPRARCPSAPRCGSGRSARRASRRAPSSR